MEYMSTLQSGVDELKPSLFELIAEQQLAGLLPPSLRYLLAVATHRHPRYLLKILNNFDEVYALLALIVERYYLKVHSGGFTENFYGLKRERVLRVKGGEVPRAQIGAAGAIRETLHLTNADVWKNLAVLVGIPYIKRKLDESYDIHAAHANVLGPGFQRDELPPNARLRERFLYCYKWFLRKIYPSVNAAYYFSLLVFNLGYLFDTSKYHSPFLWLIGSRIRRLGEADHKAVALAASSRSSPLARPGQATSIFHPRIFTRTIGPRLLSSLKIMLPASIFALKFLEWWHASDFARQLSRKAAEGLELPPPIISGLSQSRYEMSDNMAKITPAGVEGKAVGNTSDQSAKAATSSSSRRKASPPISSKTLLPIFTVPAPAPEASDQCPICHGPIVNITASPSGYVYCYTCIHRWVEGTHDRQEAFMDGSVQKSNDGPGEAPGWGDDDDDELDEEGIVQDEKRPGKRRDRHGRWESGKGRDAITGRRILGGTELLRRVVV